MTPEFTLLPFNLPGRVYRSAMPYGSYDPSGEILPTYISAQISTIVILAEEEEIIRIAGRDLKSLYWQQGWRVLHLPISDYGVPDLGLLKGTVSSALDAAGEGKHLVIHCSAGLGRTGMFAACMAKQRFGMPGEQAISWVRDTIPHAIETEGQRQTVIDF
jgi:hypothetical protein